MVNFATLSVLTVENNPHMRRLLVEMLGAFGVARVFEADTVMSAVRVVQSQPLDIVLLDFFLDMMDGADFTRIVRLDDTCINRKVPIVLLTALPNHAKVRKMRDCGVNDIVAKPVTPQTLFARMHEILAHPREFIITPTYVGPCRRRRKRDVPAHLERRKGKAVA